MSNQLSHDFSVGNVFSNSFSILKNNFVFYGITIVIIALIYSLWGIFYLQQFQQVITPTLPNFSMNTIFTLYGISMIIYMVFFAFLNTFITKAAIGDFKNESLDIGSCFSHSMAIMIPMIGLQLFYGTFMMACFFLLIIPGIIVFLNYYVAAQVKVVEGLSVMESMKKSKMLVKGHRFAIFGIFIILYIIFALISFGVTFALITPNLQNLGQNPEELFNSMTILTQIISGISYAIFAVINIIFSTVIYHELIAEKEGGMDEEVTDVFA